MKCPAYLLRIIKIFESKSELLTSHKFQFESNAVLAIVKGDLYSEGIWQNHKKMRGKITVPVSYGRNGKPEKRSNADWYNQELKTLIEVEAGISVTNYKFLKDLFQACVMIDIEYLIIVVRQVHRNSKEFDKVIQLMDALFAPNRLSLPLNGILVIAY